MPYAETDDPDLFAITGWTDTHLRETTVMEILASFIGGVGGAGSHPLRVGSIFEWFQILGR